MFFKKIIFVVKGLKMEEGGPGREYNRVKLVEYCQAKQMIIAS